MLAILEPLLADFQKGTLAWLIQRVIDDVRDNPTTIKPISESWMYIYRKMQRAPIGKVQAEKLSRSDITTYCKERRTKVKAVTVRGDLTALRSALNHASSSFPECENVSGAAIEAAWTYLVKNQLVGKGEARTRRPTDEEIAALLADLAKSDAHPFSKIKMVPIVAFALASARRRGEICRMTHGDVDYEKRVYWVRDVKHPTKKKGNDKSFALWPEVEAIIRMQPRITGRPDERIFPFDPKSVTKRYIDAKKRLKIQNLRFHDCRREAISKWLLKLGSGDKVRKLVSGHDSAKVFDKVYDGRNTQEIMVDPVIQEHMKKGEANVSRA